MKSVFSSQVQAILEAWLHPTNTSSCRTPLQALTSSLSGWVAPEEEKASREEHSSQFKPSSFSSSSLSPFQCPLDPNLWVLPGPTPPSAPGSGGQPCPEVEEDKWLLKKRNQAQVTAETSTDPQRQIQTCQFLLVSASHQTTFQAVSPESLSGAACAVIWIVWREGFSLSGAGWEIISKEIQL